MSKGPPKFCIDLEADWLLILDEEAWKSPGLDTGTPGTSRKIYSEDANGETRTRYPWITNSML